MIRLDAPAEAQETPGKAKRRGTVKGSGPPEAGTGPRTEPDLDMAHDHLQALLADAALLADDENLDDRSWAELIVRMVYSTSALRHLAEGQDEDLAPPVAEAPPAAPPEPAADRARPEPVPDLPPPDPATLLTTEAPPNLDAPPGLEPPPRVDTPPDCDTPPAAQAPAPVPVAESAHQLPPPPPPSSANAAADTPNLEMPYIPESRWRRRRGRHRVERTERNYDYFQDLRRVLDELEAAEAHAVGPAVDDDQPPGAETLAAAPESQAEPYPAQLLAPDPGDVAPPEVDDVEASGPPADRPSPGDLEPSRPEIVADRPTTRPVPFHALNQTLAELHAAEPETTEDHLTTRSVPFGDLSRALAELHAAEGAPPPNADDRISDEPGPAPSVLSDDGRAEPGASGDPEDPPSTTPGADSAGGLVTHPRSAPSDTSSPWAEHMLLGALLVVAARRPIRRLLRFLGD